MFDSDLQLQLLVIARRALEARVRGDREPPFEAGGALDTPCGAFVSIHRGVELRGCLGRLEVDWAVSRVVAHLGRAVADSDPRFHPVIADELTELLIEISVLTPEREVHSIDEVVVGRHGLIVERGYRRGLLLPQVAPEHGWNAVALAQHTCVKAGLPPDSWTRDARMFVFEAQVFGESEKV